MFFLSVGHVSSEVLSPELYIPPECRFPTRRGPPWRSSYNRATGWYARRHYLQETPGDIVFPKVG